MHVCEFFDYGEEFLRCPCGRHSEEKGAKYAAQSTHEEVIEAQVGTPVQPKPEDAEVKTGFSEASKESTENVEKVEETEKSEEVTA